MERSCRVRRALEVGRQVQSHRPESAARDLVHLRLQEARQRRVHGKVAHVAVQVHSRGQHGDGQFRPLLRALHVELVAHLRVLRRVDDKLYAHVGERLRQSHAAVEIHDASL